MTDPLRTVRATARHEPPSRPPLELHAGDELTVGHRSDEWPAFVWTTTRSEDGGWVPERYLAREAPEFDRATLLHDYSSVELAVEPGEVLDVLAEEGGWLWCRRQDGSEAGWVPARVTEPS